MGRTFYRALEFVGMWLVILLLAMSCADSKAADAKLDGALACLALNIYFEATGEPVDGQFAVAMVTLNRAKHDPAKVCDTVYAPKQFSWTANRPAVPKDDDKNYQHARRVARLAFSMQDFTDGADHYHAIHMRPDWDYRKIEITGQFGNHLFYKPRGKK